MLCRQPAKRAFGRIEGAAGILGVELAVSEWNEDGIISISLNEQDRVALNRQTRPHLSAHIKQASRREPGGLFALVTDVRRQTGGIG